MAAIQDASGARTANVNTDSELQVSLSKALDKAGLAVLTGESHDGVSGKAAIRRTARVSIDKALTTGVAVQMWEDYFNQTIFNTRKYFQAVSTMTSSLVGGFLVLNNASATASGNGVLVRTYRTFNLPAQGTLVFDFQFALSNVVQANNNIEIGWGQSTNATTTPLDGVYFSINTAGSLQLVSNFNGVTTNTDTLTGLVLAANVVNSGKLVIHRDSAHLYVNDILYGTVLRSAANTVGALSLSQAGHLYARVANAAITTVGMQLKIASWNVSQIDGAGLKTTAQVAVENFDMSVSAPDNAAVGMTGNIANSAAPASATLSNTANGYGTLGGNFLFAAPAGAETDYCLFAYQVPVNGVAAEGKSFVLTGVEIDTYSLGAAVATTPTLLHWYVGVGANAVSLATTDAATSKAPHRVSLGAQAAAIGAVPGTHYDRAISVDFRDAPLIVEPGSYVHFIVRVPLGTATASQTVRGAVTPKGYFV